MAYGYLLAPSFQFVNINGRPLVGGHIEVFIHNTDTKYITKADFDGTDNPFKVPLNSKGMAVIIADDSKAYDVFCYDALGTLFWSRENIITIGAGGGGGGDCKVEIFNCTEPNWPNPTEMFDSYNDGKDVVIVRQSFSDVSYSVWRLENVVEDLGLVKNYTLEFQNEDGDKTANHKTKRVKFYSTDYENWTTTEKTFYYPERETIAPNWNALDVSNYKKGTLVYRAGVLYRCKTNSPSSSWVDSEWEATNVSKEISRILGEQNMVLKHFKTDNVVSYELTGNSATATITLPTDKTLSIARLDNGGAKNAFISASVENVIKKAKISLGGAGKVLSRVQLSGMISIDVKIDSSESQSGTDVLISSILLKIGEWGEWEEKNIPIDFSSVTTESWSSSYRDSKPVRLVIDHSVTEFTLEDFNIQDDFVNQTLDIFIELGIEADKTTTSNGTGLID